MDTIQYIFSRVEAKPCFEQLSVSGLLEIGDQLVGIACFTHEHIEGYSIVDISSSR